MTLFWLMLGAGIALLAVYAPRLVKKHLKWFDWLWLVAAALLAFFTFAFVVASIGEGETKAALRGALLFGLPALVLIVPMIRRFVKLT